jgi:hypothetical protein
MGMVVYAEENIQCHVTLGDRAEKSAHAFTCPFWSYVSKLPIYFIEFP